MAVLKEGAVFVYHKQSTPCPDQELELVLVLELVQVLELVLVLALELELELELEPGHVLACQQNYAWLRQSTEYRTVYM